MGNHEFCTGCHASDFHYGYTCEQAYPEGRARVLKEEAEREKRRLRQNTAVEALVTKLREQNIPAEINSHRSIMDDKAWFKVVIDGNNLIGSNRKAMRDTDPKIQERRAKAYEKKYGDGW